MDTQLDKCCIIDYIIFYYTNFIYYFMIFTVFTCTLSCIVLHCDLHCIYFMSSDGFYIHVYGFMEGE
jgi:hypothetical protein